MTEPTEFAKFDAVVRKVFSVSHDEIVKREKRYKQQMADRRECSRRKVVLRCCEQPRRVYYGAVSEIKKEILV